MKITRTIVDCAKKIKKDEKNTCKHPNTINYERIINRRSKQNKEALLP